MIPPSEFIPLAEETGVIVPLGIWVLGEACRQAALWQRQYRFDEPLTMSVNISPRQLMQPGIVEAVGQMLRKHSLAARHAGAGDHRERAGRGRRHRHARHQGAEDAARAAAAR